MSSNEALMMTSTTGHSLTHLSLNKTHEVNQSLIQLLNNCMTHSSKLAGMLFIAETFICLTKFQWKKKN